MSFFLVNTSSSSSSLFSSLTSTSLFSSLTSSAALFSSGWVAWSTSGSLEMSFRTSSGTSSGWASTCSALSKYRLAQRYFLLILTENKSNEILEFYRKYLNSNFLPILFSILFTDWFLSIKIKNNEFLVNLPLRFTSAILLIIPWISSLLRSPNFWS